MHLDLGAWAESCGEWSCMVPMVVTSTRHLPSLVQRYLCGAMWDQNANSSVLHARMRGAVCTYRLCTGRTGREAVPCAHTPACVERSFWLIQGQWPLPGHRKEVRGTEGGAICGVKQGPSGPASKNKVPRTCCLGSSISRCSTGDEEVKGGESKPAWPLRALHCRTDVVEGRKQRRLWKKTGHSPALPTFPGSGRVAWLHMTCEG